MGLRMSWNKKEGHLFTKSVKALGIEYIRDETSMTI